METIKNFFTYNNGHVLNKELGKLISYGYDLHERDFNHYCNIPTFKFVNLGSSILYGKKTENGGIYGWRIYRDHSSDALITQLESQKEKLLLLEFYLMKNIKLN